MKAAMLVLLCLMAVLPAHAERLDDSLSPRQQFQLDLDWEQQHPAGRLDKRELNALTARARHVEIRLNTADYVGQSGKIFLSLPIAIRGTGDSSALRMSWTTNGVFSSGAASAGNRAKLFEGEITGSVMSDVFDFTFDIDAREVYNDLRFQPVFEIETF
jgi:hypothetical protein